MSNFVITETSKVPNSWELLPFTDCIVKTGILKSRKILTRDYKNYGKFPVIDQGQKFIAGWTDDENAVLQAELPLIIFGDHTRIFKFVNFPFAVGADGTHILKSTKDFDPRFFYYSCLNLSLPNRGYNRHFTILKEKFIPKPPKAEQQKIVAILWKVQHAIELEEKFITTTCELKQSAMRQLFTKGLRGEKQKETEIGLVPESWGVETLQDCCKVVNSSLPYTDFPELEELESGILAMAVKVSDMNLSGNENHFMKANLQKRVDIAIAQKKMIPLNTIVFPKRGAAIATNKKRLTTTWTVLDPNLIGVCAGEKVDHNYLFYWFQKFDLRSITEPGPTPQLNKKNLTPLIIAFPHKKEQTEIAEILQSIDFKISFHEGKKSALQELFRSLLHQLMTGKIRVNNLDVDVSKVI